MDAREDQRDDTDPYTTHPNPSRVVMFLLCLAMVIGGFYLMAVSFDTESPWIFTGGLLLSGAAFGIPMRESRA
ncbi:hypothetical protein [Actinotalea solisilvae]|uniref:hypothetical protein n=1 Tax=Actinotalea solisilvae TaxID=2072922 RepID=UPI0018F26F9B|nr:hypothetical protein [Actinotalea solisilvae]